MASKLTILTTVCRCLTLLYPLQLHMKSGAVAGAPLHNQQQPTDCPMLTLRVSADTEAGIMVTLNLIESSTDFLHSSERSGGSGGSNGVGTRRQHFEPSPLSSCFYQGSVEGHEGLAVAKQRNGRISGYFHFGGRAFDIPEQQLGESAAATAAAPLIARPLPPPAEKFRCGLNATKSAGAASVEVDIETVQKVPNNRSSRFLKIDTYSAFSEPLRTYIRLILIGDQAFYEKHNRSVTVAKDRLRDIGNYVNALYKQLGVNVIIVHTDAWVTDPYTLSTRNAVNIIELHGKFKVYRMGQLGFKPHSAAYLISGLKLVGTVGGVADLSSLCAFENGVGIGLYQVSNAYTAAIVAHELGHNLGIDHDGNHKGCICPDRQGCIMTATAQNWMPPIQFSKCSIARFREVSVPNGFGYCMSDPPHDSATVGTMASCGNRIVEAGEDCDCGLMSRCNNTCCNPNTCKFTAGATCASGECCNRATCTLMSQGTVCRGSRGTCDLPEYCNGSSEWCPQFDDYKVDGTECLAGKAYCYKGRCNDRDSRCTDLFKGDNVTAAPATWSNGNRRGKMHGFCSYVTNFDSFHTYKFRACTTANQRCGLLYCLGAGETKWIGSLFEERLLYYLDGIAAVYALFNLKYSGYRDPGMVPNGAECGINKMCVDSVCVPAASNVTCPNCSGRGDCAQSGLCFCQTGYRPPDCVQTGGGGSLTNRLPDLGQSDGKTRTSTATSIGTSTGTSIRTGTVTSIGTSTVTSYGTSIETSTGTSTGTNIRPSTGTSTGTSIGASTGTSTGTSTSTSVRTSTGTSTSGNGMPSSTNKARAILQKSGNPSAIPTSWWLLCATQLQLLIGCVATLSQ